MFSIIVRKAPSETLCRIAVSVQVGHAVTRPTVDVLVAGTIEAALVPTDSVLAVEVGLALPADVLAPVVAALLSLAVRDTLDAGAARRAGPALEAVSAGPALSVGAALQPLASTPV